MQSVALLGAKPPPHEELRSIVTRHLEEHNAEAAEQDERWRARIFKELSKAKVERDQLKQAQADGLERAAKEQAKVLAAQTAEIKDLRLILHQLTKRDTADKQESTLPSRPLGATRAWRSRAGSRRHLSMSGEI